MFTCNNKTFALETKEDLKNARSIFQSLLVETVKDGAKNKSLYTEKWQECSPAIAELKKQYLKMNKMESFVPNNSQ